jgi:predicted nucleotidyltransferase
VGKYSVKGSPAFDARIDADMKRIADALYASKFSKHWKALVLLGGYGRGEGSPLIQKTEDGGSKGEIELPFNDYDLVVVTDSLDPLLKRALKALEKELTAELGLPVDLYPYLTSALPKCEFSLLNYEMKYGHRVIRGDKNILDAMPAYPHDAIPLSEGTRLLLNRGKLLLDIKCRLAKPDALTKEDRQKFLKFLFKADLAFGDCALLLRKAYDLSYVVKRSRLPEIDLSGLENSRAFVESYRRAIDFKERADFQSLEDNNVHLRLADTIQRYEQFFLWYERRRLNRKFQTLEKYAREFPYFGKEGSPLKNAVHNLRTFGTQGLRYGTTHPRLRLYAALPLLLTKHSDRVEICWLLQAKENSFETLCKNFYALQQRFP